MGYVIDTHAYLTAAAIITACTDVHVSSRNAQQRLIIHLQESIEAAIESAAQQTCQDLQALVQQAGPSQTAVPSAAGKENNAHSLKELNAHSNALLMTPAVPPHKHSKQPAARESSCSTIHMPECCTAQVLPPLSA